MQFHSRAVTDTHLIAQCIASVAMPGDVLVLAGDLGAGKTAFVQGFAEHFGVDEPVTSPTFAIAQVYATRDGGELIHADVYRLASVGELADLGLAEALDDGAIALIEWGDRIGNAVSDDYLVVSLTAHETDDDARIIRLEPMGTSWHARRVALERACATADSRCEPEPEKGP